MTVIKFTTYGGNISGLAVDDNHHVFKWVNDDCNILFSMCKQGNAASCHFSSDKKGLRYLKQAINDFVEFCYKLYPWCEMVLAVVGIDSVGRLITKCGFNKIAYNEQYDIYLRV